MWHSWGRCIGGVWICRFVVNAGVEVLGAVVWLGVRAMDTITREERKEKSDCRGHYSLL